MRHSLLLLPLLAACGSMDSTLDRLEKLSERSVDDDLGRQDIAPPTSPGDALVAIARLEDARDDGGGLLQILAGTFTPPVRRRAVLALGRLPLESHGEEVTRALTAALGDEVAEVREAAAFALGQRADAHAAEALLARWLDPEPAVRARLVEAAGRIAAGEIDAPELRAKVLDALRSPLAVVRRAAATAPHAWDSAADDAGAVDLALAELAAHLPQGDPRAARLEIPATSLEDPEVIWRVLFCLARRGAEAGRDAFHAHRLDEDPRARLYALQGLGKLIPHDAGRQALEDSISDPDWRVVVEAARGLGSYADRRSLDALERALAHDSAHVRLEACAALGAFRVEPARIATLLDRGRQDRSPVVRATALTSDAALRGALARPTLEEAAADPDPVLRAGAALGAGRLPDEHALALLLPLSADPHPRVAGMAISALATNADERAHARLIEVLGLEDNGLRASAAVALREQARSADLGALAAAYEGAHGDISPEARVEILRTVKRIDDPEARALLARAETDDHPWVRRMAQKIIDPDPAAARTRPARFEAPRAEPALPLPGRDYSLTRANPRVEVETSRGTMLFELFRAEAPVHVHNFLTLVRAGHYDGLDFHRVVPDFVIQGGCYRGDGYGSGTWRGRDDALRHEFTPRGYVRGSLGMPRGEDQDSGGNQFFVTHRETPHLDGRYTIFGELREGFDVLDAVEVGDRILAVRER